MNIPIKPEKIAIREKTGGRVDKADKPSFAPTYTDENNDETKFLPTCIFDKETKPDIPIPDNRIENFLDEVVDKNIRSTAGYFDAFRRHVTPITGDRRTDKANLRRMLLQPRVKARLQFLREAEWELNKPNIQGIASEFEALIESEDLRPADKINALNSLSKLVGLFEVKQQATSSGVTVTFNMQEQPRIIDVTSTPTGSYDDK